jgi:hypothetical protein
MERSRISAGQAVVVKPETGSRRSRSLSGQRAFVIDLEPDPKRPDRVKVRFERGGTSIVRIHRLQPAIERINP